MRSHQVVQLLFVQVLHDLTDILGALARGDEQSVFGFDHHQIVHADGGDELSRRMNIVAGGIQSENTPARDQVPAFRLAFAGVVLMQRVPGS